MSKKKDESLENPAFVDKLLRRAPAQISKNGSADPAVQGYRTVREALAGLARVSNPEPNPNTPLRTLRYDG